MEESAVGIFAILALFVFSTFFLAREPNTSLIARRPFAFRTALISLWEKTHFLPFGITFFNLVVRIASPYSSVSRCKVIDIDPGRVKISVKNRWIMRDTDGSIDPAALVGPAKIAATLALSTVAYNIKPKLEGYSCACYKKYRGDLFAECLTSVPRAGPFETVVRFTNQSGDVFNEIKFLWTCTKNQAPSIVRFR